MHHPETALTVGNFLAAEPADLSAHVTIHHPPQPWHRRDVIHPGADEQLRAGRSSSDEKPRNLFRQMLAVTVEDDRVLKAALEPVAESSLYRLAFPAILRVNDHLGACLSRGLRGGVGRAVIDHQDVI